MIPHQGKGLEVQGISGLVFREVREIGSKIPLTQKNRLLLVLPADYLVEGTEEMNPRSSRPRRFITQQAQSLNTLL